MPRKRIPADIRSLARGHTELCIKVLAGVAQNGESETARVAAAVALLDRGWGRPPQAQTGRDGDGEIRVIIRHLAEGRDATGVRQVIEARPVPVITANGEDDEP